MKRLTWILIIFAVLFLTACAAAIKVPAVETETAVPETAPEEVEEVVETAVPTAAKPEPTEAPTEEPTEAPTPAPEEVEESESVELGEITSEDIIVEAADGLELDATFYAAEGLENAPGVILLHMLGSRRTVWEQVGLADELAANGYAVLALDMRGHGDTGRAADWVQAEDDIQRVWQYLVDRPEVDGERTAVIGGSIGSNMALIAAANEPAIKTAVLLSPGLVYRGVTIEDRLPDIGERPLFIIASEDDYYSEDTANKLAETAVGETEVLIYENAGHGTNMFAPQPDLIPLILDWLAQHT
jgi:pimeloyl-ACP methyl ester carboxylesterase